MEGWGVVFLFCRFGHCSVLYLGVYMFRYLKFGYMSVLYALRSDR